MNLTNQLNHEAEFERAWAYPAYTQIEQPALDVNRALAKRYCTGEPLTFTRTMLWDMEARKALRPDRYIPTVVRQGSAQAWGRSSLSDGSESFVRASTQRLWLEHAAYGLVLEQVRLNHAQQTVRFIGTAAITELDGKVLRASSGQPLFHVEHAVGGEESRPLNKWRIVHLTDKPDPSLVETFIQLTRNGWLPEFIEIYIRDDLNIKLRRREALRAWSWRR